MNSLYRFISFPAFANLVEKQVERYVSPISWEDTYEGYLLRLIKKNDIKEVIKELMNTISPNNPEAALKNYRRFGSAMASAGRCSRKAMPCGAYILTIKWPSELKQMKGKSDLCSST